MPPLKNQLITGFVAGDDLSLEETVAGVPAGLTLVKAWLTIKAKIADLDVAALAQKVITTSAQAGVGQITDPGASGTGALLFLIVPADFGTGKLLYDVAYVYDVQVKFSDATIATLELGTIRFERGVTDAAS